MPFSIHSTVNLDSSPVAALWVTIYIGPITSIAATSKTYIDLQGYNSQVVEQSLLDVEAVIHAFVYECVKFQYVSDILSLIP